MRLFIDTFVRWVIAAGLFAERLPTLVLPKRSILYRGCRISA
jgi:hypothetical protein